MQKFKPLSGLVFLFLYTSLSVSQAQVASYVEDEVIVQLHPGYDPAQVVASAKELAGNASKLSVDRIISSDMRMYVLQFDPAIYDVISMIGELYRHPGIQTAQVNHVLSQRGTLPNDPLIGSQWQYVNTGAGGGAIDADIDADDAWDLATGGLTALGDTIVVCVIDDGLDLTHADFGDNLWINHDETPGNGIDDDNNGYIDDYAGWNAYDLNDNIGGGIFGGGHGTPVAGIVGARGDNGVGVSGVNWHVKLMIVVGGGNEADALAAYAYPLTMRKRYNATNGAQGAFVVSTNASWGIDFGQPSSAPLWCAMYDSLGKYGILNCGATINSNQNVDVVGDLPTACPSDYLISVTNMNDQDIKVGQAGYGATTIDLGAHGEGTYTTAAGNSYGGFGGTSGATPHVTGAIALLYSAPCPNLIAFAHSYPDSAARLMREFILNGTDPNASLAGITTTGGRLNLYNSLLELLNYDCAGGDCFQAYALGANGITDIQANLTWSALASAMSFDLEYRQVGALNWTALTTTANSLTLSALTPCTSYEFRVKANCDTSSSAFSNPFVFQTDGCCEIPSGILETGITETTAEFEWTDLIAALSYNVRYKEVGSTGWTNINALTSPMVTISGLDTCTVYEIQFQTVCDTGTTPFSPGVLFETAGCTGCPYVVYCPSSSQNTQDEWIERIAFGGIDHTSGDDGGYGDHTSISTKVYVDSSYQFTFEPGFSGFSYDEWWLAWIDFNHDGDFDDAEELVFDADTADDLVKTGQISIPGNATLGNTRFRISMRYQDPAMPCLVNFDFGEVEDYCIEIARADSGNGNPSGISSTSTNQPEVLVFPNPTSGAFTISWRADLDLQINSIRMFSSIGKLVSFATTIRSTNQIMLSLTEPSPGIYFLQFEAGGESIVERIVIY